jgi:hypothetical protein
LIEVELKAEAKLSLLLAEIAKLLRHEKLRAES